MIEKEYDGVKLRVYTNSKIESFHHNKWHELKGTINCYGYCRVSINGKEYMKHRVIGWAFLGLDINNLITMIYHIDRNKSNNHIKNLRIVSRQQNMFNTDAKGYYWNKLSKKWHAQIRLDKKLIHLGYFDKEEDAHNAYLSAKIKYHVI